MVKSVRKKIISSSANDPAMPCQSDLHGVSHKGFSKFEEIALRAMLQNPILLQHFLDKGLTPAEMKDNITTASFQYSADMIEQFNTVKKIL